MALPAAFTYISLEVCLLAAALLLFLPSGVPRALGHREAARVPRKYGYYILAASVVLLIHLLVIQGDRFLTASLGRDYAPSLATIEGSYTTLPSRFAIPELDFLFATVYVVLHPLMMVLPATLFLLSEEERAAKAALLIYPLAYAFALPFFLFFPATNPALHLDVANPPLLSVYPDASRVFLDATTPNNTVPAFEVAVALLTWNAARFSRNGPFQAFSLAYAVLAVAAAWYVGVNWVTGIALAALIAGFVAVLTGRILSVERITLSRIRPDPETAHHIRAIGEELTRKAGDAAVAVGVPDAQPMLVGSVAKDTYLVSKVDLDVFVLFPKETPRELLEKKGLEIGRAVLENPEAKYAEHPYLTGTFRSYHADLVPAYRIEDPSERMSAVDRTPFHTRYVLSRMERDQRDQVRLLKQFMGALGVYGAESRVRGFSGYLAELLVIKYGSFRGVVAAGARWFPGQYLVLEPLENPPTFQDALVVIDPVDARRNVASAVSRESLLLFIAGCQAYLARPALSFFFPRRLIPLTPEQLRPVVERRGTELVLLEMDRPDVLEDHLYDQLRKAGGALTLLLERSDFKVEGWTYDLAPTKARLLFEVSPPVLSETYVHAGPPVKEPEHAERFRKAWAGNPEARGPVYEEKGRLMVERPRPHRTPGELVKARWKGLDLGKHLTKAMERGFSVLTGADVVREENAPLLTRHLNTKRPWEI
ncbi:MAG TPA: CCA tRNA nucleotidyltransferase [Candidatus Thermoplasmatota archaeon]|nr:CCA tRNA nucleotidyltransferase [Candidatus Thermoplasmatota archaeon]